MPLNVTIFRRHPILLPAPASSHSVSVETAGEAHFSRTLDPHPVVVELCELAPTRIDPLDDDHPSWRQILNLGHGVKFPIVTMIPGNLATPKGEQHLFSKPGPIKVATNRLGGGLPAAQRVGRAVEK